MKAGRLKDSFNILLQELPGFSTDSSGVVRYFQLLLEILTS